MLLGWSLRSAQWSHTHQAPPRFVAQSSGKGAFQTHQSSDLRQDIHVLSHLGQLFDCPVLARWLCHSSHSLAVYHFVTCIVGAITSLRIDLRHRMP